ncbi:MAG: hypothetical protein KGI57_03040, partial [Hyphomicrobiales bacterium]|nr:hypothetical protein [Hyphomicrobiales bacterium]
GWREGDHWRARIAFEPGEGGGRLRIEGLGGRWRPAFSEIAVEALGCAMPSLSGDAQGIRLVPARP